jgi:hypothetical protein
MDSLVASSDNAFQILRLTLFYLTTMTAVEYVCMYVCMCVYACMYVCMYVCMYINHTVQTAGASTCHYGGASRKCVCIMTPCTSTGSLAPIGALWIVLDDHYGHYDRYARYYYPATPPAQLCLDPSLPIRRRRAEEQRRRRRAHG